MAGVTLQPVRYADIEGWANDDHDDALAAFILSAGHADAPLAIRGLAQVAAASRGQTNARAFFESNFVPHAVVHDGAPGFLTGYYEPVVAGARARSSRFCVPAYRRPPDLVNLIAEAERGARAGERSHARQTTTGLEPYSTRTEIEAGALDGQNLELVWFESPVDLFFMQVQGSGRVRLDDGTLVRLTYDGKNGHPYTSIGRALVDAGIIPAAEMSLATLRHWLEADVERGRETMRLNASYVFFRELDETREPGPQGVLGTCLRAGRSLAVDTAFNALGVPVWVTAPTLLHFDGRPFARLMVAQDVGSAIRGPERGDIYFGSGAEAGARAGETKHPGRFVMLLPRAAVEGGSVP